MKLGNNQSFSISVRGSSHIRDHGHAERLRAGRYRITIASYDPRLRQILTFIHECLHVAVWVWRPDTKLRKEHAMIHRVERHLKREWKRSFPQQE